MISEAPLPTIYPPISPTKQPNAAIKPINKGMKIFICRKGCDEKHTTNIYGVGTGSRLPITQAQNVINNPVPKS